MLKKVLKMIARKVKAAIGGIFWYVRDLTYYKKLLKEARISLSIRLFPQIFDKDPNSHTFDKHYVYMDRWACKLILRNRPVEHIDVGSSIRFLSLASCLTKVKFVDIRPVKIDFDNFEYIEGSILKMPFADNSIESLSCLHVAEHIGLGRYGDPLDPQGTVKACKELVRILKLNGVLYFALPIGRQVTYFNAHRVHNPNTIVEYFKGLKLEGFSAVNDQGNFVENAKMEDFENAIYVCGMFKFTKKNG